MYKITIPGNFNNTQFCSNNLVKTIDEAKYEAANFVLSQIFQKDATNTDETYRFLENSVLPHPYIYMNRVNSDHIIASCSPLVENSVLNQSIATLHSISHQVQMTSPPIINGEISTVIPTPSQYFVDSDGYTFISS